MRLDPTVEAGGASGERPPLRLAIVVKGYPRLSETFVAQEILALERRGFAIDIWSLRRPTDRSIHDLHRQIQARLFYLPEYLYQGPLRVFRGAWAATKRPGLRRFLQTVWRDIRRDPTPSRLRRVGQALVLAREIDPAHQHIYVHFLHTPGSVARYAAILMGGSFSFSAHAKDIWTIPDWEKREKIADSAWGATCTCTGRSELQRLSPPGDPGRVRLVYHGLDLSRFPPPPERTILRDGSDPADPVRIVSVGRAVAKKGYGDLLAALKALPPELHWRFDHIGSGELLAELKAEAERLGLSDRISWRGAQAQGKVIEALRTADLFVLPCREGDNGDRDGLPNVIMEAATQELAILSTDFAGVPEFVGDGREGRLVPPQDAAALATVMAELIVDPLQRQTLGGAAYARVREHFSMEAGIDRLEEDLRSSLERAKALTP